MRRPLCWYDPGCPCGLGIRLTQYQKCAIVDIDTNLVIKQDLNGVRAEVLEHIDIVAKFTGTDIFLLNPRPQDPEGADASYGNGSDVHFDQRLRIAIYGDPESSEHAKTRILIMIDQIVSNTLLPFLNHSY